MGIIKRKLNHSQDQMALGFEATSALHMLSHSKRILRGLKLGVNKIIIEPVPVLQRAEPLSDERENKDASYMDADILIAQQDTMVHHHSQPEETTKTGAELDELKSQLAEEKTNAEKSVQASYQQGYEKGVSDTEKKLASQSREIMDVINSAIEEKNRILKNAEEGVLMLALDIVEQIIKTEVSLNHETMRQIVSEALTRISDADKVVVRVHPDDLAALREHVSVFESKFPSIRHVMIQEDPIVEQGGCILETDLGYIDATLKTKLDIVKNALFDSHHQ